jgi:integrase
MLVNKAGMISVFQLKSLDLCFFVNGGYFRLRRPECLIDLVTSANPPGSTGRKGHGRPMSRTHAFRIIVGAAKDCGFDTTRISNHTGRKTFVRRCYLATGKELIATQRILNHASPITTARYVETDANELDQVVLGLCS